MSKQFDNDDERVHLVNGKSDANDIELTNNCDHLSDSSAPDWVSNVDEFRYEINKINTKCIIIFIIYCMNTSFIVLCLICFISGSVGCHPKGTLEVEDDIDIQ